MAADPQRLTDGAQDYPGSTGDMSPRPHDEMAAYQGRGLLAGRRALVTGGDSGIGRAVAVAFAKEGADVAIAYLEEHDDAARTGELIQMAGRKAELIPGDLSRREACDASVERTVDQLGGLDVLVNNVAFQAPADSLESITDEQLERTFRTNIFSYMWVTRAALGHMGPGSSIVNTGSVNGLRGNKSLIDYATTKGAVHTFTYSMAQALADRRIRINCVAPGPVWTPLIPATMPEEKVESFGEHVPFGRPAQPDELAPSFVFFASELSSYSTGEVLGALGGETHPG